MKKELSKEDKIRLTGIAFCMLGMVYDDALSEEQREIDLVNLVRNNREISNEESREKYIQYIRDMIDDVDKKLGNDPVDWEVNGIPVQDIGSIWKPIEDKNESSK